MFIERATFKRVFLDPAERDLVQPSGSVAGNIALRWSARPQSIELPVYRRVAGVGGCMGVDGYDTRTL